MGFLAAVKSWLGPEPLDVTTRFELDCQATSGTMSTFYKARDRRSGATVGLKLLNAEKSAAFERLFAGLDKPSEGEIAVALVHPRIVRTIEHGITTDGRPYLVMEYLDGVGLHALLATNDPRLANRRLTLLRWAAEALASVHRAGFVHRDVCPRNFLVGHCGQWLKLIDFGLTIPARPEFLSRPNRTGVPRYLAPEVLRMRPFDHRSDIFSLGVVAYELLSGRHPWPTADTSGLAAVAHDTQPPLDLAAVAADLEPSLTSAIMSCLAADPTRRPGSVDELLRRIDGVALAPSAQ